MRSSILLALAPFALACQSGPSTSPPPDATASTQGANVTAVEARGDPGAYTFHVTVQSPDTGFDRFANWWEVIDDSGALVYRRILLHSHVSEQPFTRSGGPIEVTATQTLWVRAHMLPEGYTGLVLKGSVQSGFQPADATALGADLERVAPQPEGCAF